VKASGASGSCSPPSCAAPANAGGLCPRPWALPTPLRVHGRYSRAEIEAAFGILRDDAPWIHREGMLWHQPGATDLMCISLRKSEALFFPSTRYRDLALGPSLFHWESQSSVGWTRCGSRSYVSALPGTRATIVSG